MVLRGTGSGRSCIVSLKAESVAISVNETTVAAWDRGGRLYSLYADGLMHRRGLSGQMLVKRDQPGERRRQRLDGSDADIVVDAAARLARETAGALRAADWRWAGPVDRVTAQEAVTVLDLCGRFSAGTARADAGRFARVYSPVGMLPPDQYLSLVVQATEGCSFNTCTFCDLYHEPYRVKSTEEFGDHLSAVLEYMGESAQLRSRGIFLGAANALAVPMTRLVPVFEVLVDRADAIRRGVYAFVDGFTGQMKEARDYRLLHHLGLRRVYVGLESGHDPLLAFVCKPGTSSGSIDAVRAMKAGGLQVGVIVMTGLGGTRFAAAHVADTTVAINAMGLGAGDLLYFSELVEMPGQAGPAVAADETLKPLTDAGHHAQRQAIRTGLRFPGAPPHVSTYDVREFVY